MIKFKRYLVSYRHDGGERNIEIPATSFEDARRRLGQLHFGRVEGELIARIPSSIGAIAVLAAWARNAVSTLGR